MSDFTLENITRISDSIYNLCETDLLDEINCKQLLLGVEGLRRKLREENQVCSVEELTEIKNSILAMELYLTIKLNGIYERAEG